LVKTPTKAVHFFEIAVNLDSSDKAYLKELAHDCWSQIDSLEMAGYPVVIAHRGERRFLIRTEGFLVGAPGMKSTTGGYVQGTGDFSG
jgi:hypothetical protein